MGGIRKGSLQTGFHSLPVIGWFASSQIQSRGDLTAQGFLKYCTLTQMFPGNTSELTKVFGNSSSCSSEGDTPLGYHYVSDESGRQKAVNHCLTASSRLWPGKGNATQNRMRPPHLCLNIQMRRCNAHCCRGVMGKVRERKTDRDRENTIRSWQPPRLNPT